MKKERKLNILYCFAQAFYWMSHCVAISYSAVYLQGLGCTNTQLGLLLSLGNILGFILSNTLGTLIDRYERITAINSCFLVMGINIFIVAINTTIIAPSWVLYITYPLYISLVICVNSLIIKLWADFDHYGRQINYSFARAFSSVFYAPLSIILGIIIPKTSVVILPYTALAIIALQLIDVLLLSKEFQKTLALHSTTASTNDVNIEATPLLAFIKNNFRFFVLILGLALIFVSHYITSSFLINIVKNIGGDTKTLGIISAYMAALEIPVLTIIYPRIRKKISSAKILRFAVVFFIFKALGIALAPSVPSLYLIYFLHIPSYSLYIASIVDYVNDVIPYKDSAKGHSLASSVMTLGTIIAGIVGGRLYDIIGVRNTALTAVAVAACGVIICLLGIDSSVNVRE